MYENFKFRKFNPDQEITMYANTMLSQIMDIAPDNSSCHASMAKMKNSYTAWLQITSSEGKFAAEAHADDPRLAVDLLDEQIRLRINKWKASRKLTARAESRRWRGFEDSFSSAAS